MKLQNNFTSPEQSRRLLELGLPADSADCYWHFIRRNEHALLRTELRWLEPPYVDKYTAFVDMAVGHDKYRANRLKTYLPCWSVGRLIEISIICGIGDKVPTELYINKYSLEPLLVENIIHRLEMVADLSVNDISFSRLED